MLSLLALVAYVAFPFFVTLPSEGMSSEQRNLRTRKLVCLWAVGFVILAGMIGAPFGELASETRYG